MITLLSLHDPLILRASFNRPNIFYEGNALFLIFYFLFKAWTIIIQIFTILHDVQLYCLNSLIKCMQREKSFTNFCGFPSNMFVCSFLMFVLFFLNSQIIYDVHLEFICFLCYMLFVLVGCHNMFGGVKIYRGNVIQQLGFPESSECSMLSKYLLL